MTKKRADVAIVGAGLIGSALALWLSKHTRLSVVLIERNAAMSAPLEPNQRVVALGHLANNFLRDVNAFDVLNSEQRHPYHLMRVWDENSNGELEFDSNKLDQPQLGCMVDSLACNYVLQQLLLEQAQSKHSKLKSVDCYFGASLNSLRRENGRGHLSAKTQNGETLDVSAQLIVAADGGRSWVRQQAAIFANHRDFKQRGIVARIETEKSHQDCAWQRFLSTGPIAILPLANNQSSIVWSADNMVADELLSLSQLEFEVRLEHALQGRLGRVSLLSGRAGFPLQSQSAEAYYKRNVVLVGDAAHSVHPLAGQGANMGFKDCLVLGRLLAELSEDDAMGKQLGEPQFLAKYQRKRQTDNQQADALMSALQGGYQWDRPIWMAARGIGMNVLNRTSVLRDLLAKQAMGI